MLCRRYLSRSCVASLLLMSAVVVLLETSTNAFSMIPTSSLTMKSTNTKLHMVQPGMISQQQRRSEGENENDNYNDNNNNNFTSRRSLLLSLSGAVAASAAMTTNKGQSSSSSSTTTLFDNVQLFPKTSPYTIQTLSSIQQAVQMIDESCDRSFLHAVVASDYQFMYRGMGATNKQRITVQQEPSDLLSIETYGKDDPSALKWFQGLESLLQNDKIQPSNGHLATTSPTDAAMWGGRAVSIWPLTTTTTANGNDCHYAWFQTGGLFYPRNSPLERSQIIVDGKDCGHDSLEDALLSDNCEIMFKADTFLAVPYELDSQLRQSLQSSFLI